LIKTPYLTQCPWKSHKTNELWMSQATMFLHDMWFYFQFWCSKTSRITRKTPAKKSNSRNSWKVIQSNFLEPTWSNHWLQTVWQMQGHWTIRCNWNSELH
jgi:hypothetical protein